MTRQSLIRTLALTAGLLLPAAAASAQVVQSFHVSAGAFLPRSFDVRVDRDVLVEDLTTVEPLLFNINEFKSWNVGGEWLVAFNKHIEFSAGLSYYNEAVPSIYCCLVNSLNNDSDISQTLRLQIMPITGLVRFLPFGGPGSFQPYAGVGVSALTWRYSEVGDFVDLSDNTIFPAQFRASGVAPGVVLVLGARVPIGGDIYGLSFEWRNQFGSGDTGGAENGFLSDKVDLGGQQINFGFLVRF